MNQIASTQIVEQRFAAADMYYQGYDFGCNIEDHNGWEQDSSEPNMLSRVIFLESPIKDENHEDYGSVKAYFNVVFAPNSDMVVDAYAINIKGNIFGAVPPMTAGVVPDEGYPADYNPEENYQK